MSSIAESIGIWRFGRLAFIGMGCSLGVCYGKFLIVTLLVLFGLAEDFNPDVQAFSMVFFAVFGIWGLVRDRKAGKQRLYSLDARELRPVHEWTGGFERFWNESFDRLDAYVRDLKQARQEECS